MSQKPEVVKLYRNAPCYGEAQVHTRRENATVGGCRDWGWGRAGSFATKEGVATLKTPLKLPGESACGSQSGGPSA